MAVRRVAVGITHGDGEGCGVARSSSDQRDHSPDALHEPLKNKMKFEQLPSGASDVGMHGQRHGGSSGMHLLEEPEGGNDRLGHCASID